MGLTPAKLGPQSESHRRLWIINHFNLVVVSKLSCIFRFDIGFEIGFDWVCFGLKWGFLGFNWL